MGEFTDLVLAVYEKRTDPAMQCVLRLIDHMIRSIREENDDASGQAVIENQGRLKALKGIKSFITIGYGIIAKNS